MFHRKLLFFPIALSMLTLTASAAQQQPAMDGFGDPLPDGAVERLGTIRWRHNSTVIFATFLPDGKKVISVGKDRTIRIWEYPSGKELRRLGPLGDADAAPISSAQGGFPVALSKDGKTIAVRFGGDEVRLFEVNTGKQLPTLKAARVINDIAFSPDGQHLAVVETDGSIHIWDWVKAKELRTFAGPGPDEGVFAGKDFTRFFYSSDGKSLATVRLDQQSRTSVLALWNPATGNRCWVSLRDFKTAGLFLVVFSPDSKTLAFATGTTITLVETATGKEIRTWKRSQNKKFADLALLQFSPDGTKLYACSNQVVTEWDAGTGKDLRQLELPIPVREFQGIATVALSPDGEILVFAGLHSAPRFFDLTAGKEVGTSGGPASALVSVNFAPDGKQVFAVTSAGAVRRWELGTGKDLGSQVQLPKNGRSIVQPGGKVLVVQSLKGQGIVFMDVISGKEIVKISADAWRGDTAVLLSPDGTVLAVRLAQDKQISLYDVPTGKLLRNIAIAPGDLAKPGADVRWLIKTGPSLLFFSADGKKLAAYADPVTVGVWDTASGQRTATLKLDDSNPVNGGAFSADGYGVVLDANDNTVALYELASGQVRRTFGTKLPKVKGPADVDGGVETPLARPLPPTRIVFARDAQTLLYAGLDGVIHVCDAMSGKEVRTFKGHAGTIHFLAIAPDGKTLASASADTTVLLWDLTCLVRPAVPAKAMAASEVQARWKDLLERDAATAFAAVCDLSAAPKEALALIAEQLKPALPLDLKLVEKWIADLDSKQFPVRQQAHAELSKLDGRVLPALDKALAGNPLLETKARLEDLRTLLTSVVLHGERLRMCRAVEILERIGTAEARQVLQALADGAPGALVTTTAQAALARLGQQK